MKNVYQPPMKSVYQPPDSWRLNAAATAELGRQRFSKARRHLRKSKRHPNTVIREYRLDNPYMAEHAFNTLLSMAKKGRRLKSSGYKAQTGETNDICAAAKVAAVEHVSQEA